MITEKLCGEVIKILKNPLGFVVVESLTRNIILSDVYCSVFSVQTDS